MTDDGFYRRWGVNDLQTQRERFLSNIRAIERGGWTFDEHGFYRSRKDLPAIRSELTAVEAALTSKDAPMEYASGEFIHFSRWRAEG